MKLTEQGPPAPAVETQSRDFKFLLGTAFLFFLGFSIYNTVFINFASEEIKISPTQLGLLESVREIPGLLSVGIAAITMWLVEPVLAAIALAIMAIGVVNYLHVNSIWALLLFSLIWSIGFHTWAPLASSMALRIGPAGKEGRRLGMLRSSSNVGGLLGIATVFTLVRFASVPYRPMFALAGVVIFCAALLLLAMRNRTHVVRQRIVLRRRYWLFYLLEFLNGTRRHVFMTFALFALVRVYSTSVETISILSFVNQLFSVGAAYAVGRLIDRYGERRILALGFAGLTAVFLGYAFVETVGILFALYVIDSILFSVSMGIEIYGKKILLHPSDLRPTLVAGQTMNHIAAVVIPVTGGLLWQAYGYVVPFVIGSAVAFISVGVSLLINVRGPRAAVAAELPVRAEPAPVLAPGA